MWQFTDEQDVNQMTEMHEKDIDEIMKRLGDDFDRAEIEKEFLHYMKEFRLKANEAKKAVLKKHAPRAGIGGAEQKKVKDLTPLDNNVTLVVGVVFAASKRIKADGKEKDIVSGIVGDETGTVPFTVWEKGALELKKGDAIRIESAYVTEYRDEPQVNVGNRGRVTMLDKSEMPDIKSRGGGPSKEAKVRDLGEASGNVSLVARILNMETREVTVGGEAKQVMSGTMADETGKVAFTCWGLMKAKEGDVIRVSSGYLRRWRGMPQLNFDAANAERSKDKMPECVDLERPAAVTIERLAKAGGMVDAAVEGVILDVRQGSGLVFRCPDCKRVLQKGVCRVHGEKEGVPDLRTKAVIDDGTGAMTAILGREISERLLEKSLDKCLKEAQKSMDTGIIAAQLFDRLVARNVRVTGNVTSDEFGLMLIATSTEFMAPDPRADAKRMLEELL